MRPRLREVELVRAVGLALQRATEPERAYNSHSIRRLICKQA